MGSWLAMPWWRVLLQLYLKTIPLKLLIHAHLLWVWLSQYLVFSCKHWFVNMNTTKLNKNQTQPHKSKSRSQSYTNVGHLHSSFPKERYHLLDAKLDLLFMSETSTSMPVQELVILVYLSLISKHNHQNHHNHGLSAYIKNGFPCGTCLHYHFHFYSISFWMMKL